MNGYVLTGMATIQSQGDSSQVNRLNVTVKALLKQYNNLPMPDPALNQAKARSMLEYLRSLEK